METRGKKSLKVYLKSYEEQNKKSWKMIFQDKKPLQKRHFGS